MNREINKHTQPQRRYRVFNNAQVVPKAWYICFPSNELPKGSIKPFELLNQRIVLYRGESGRVFALDSFCPHMGTDLAIGKVSGNQIRCFFHHWTFDGKGKCTHIPISKNIPPKAKLRHYAIEEKYGFLWVYPDANPDVPLLEVPGMEGKPVIHSHGKANFAQSHHHISMINGLDAQHLNTVHNMDIKMELSAQDHGQTVEYTLTGETPTRNFMERAVRWLLGPRYGYSMKYSQATLASLTLMRETFFRKPAWKWPRLHMFYAYRPLPDGKSMTIPIYVTQKRSGIVGWLVSHFLLFLTKRAYFFLKDEDDKIYDNIRFNPENLLEMDKPIGHYISFVERLMPSDWGNTPLKIESAPALPLTPQSELDRQETE